MTVKEQLITVIGSLNYDIVFKQERLPSPGETYTADSVQTAGGGKGANQAVQCAKLGAQTYMVGAVGNDAMGSFLRDSLEKYGVETRYLLEREGGSGFAVVHALEDGTVAATLAKGANYALTRDDIEAVRDLLKRSKIAVFQMEIPRGVLEYAIEIAAAEKCFIVLNAAPATPIDSSVLKKVDCLVVNEVEASYYCGAEIRDRASAEQQIEALRAKCGRLVIITLGVQGSVIYDGQRLEFIPAKKVEAIESTGAGDSYIGAFSVRLLEGEDCFSAARFAAEAAAITVTGIGAQPSMPTREQLR